MKKENKEMAKQKRAKERAKQSRKNKAKSLAGFWIPLLCVCFVVVVLVWAIVTSGDDSSTEETQDQVSTQTTVTTTDDVTEDPNITEDGYCTEQGLVVYEGDTVNIDYTGYLDGEAFEGGSTDGNGTDLTLGSGSYIDGFEEGLEGHTVGEEVELNLTFPEDYSTYDEDGNIVLSDLAGKDVVFDVTINGVYID